MGRVGVVAAGNAPSFGTADFLGYDVVVVSGTDADAVAAMALDLGRRTGLRTAGFVLTDADTAEVPGEVPADLVAFCLEQFGGPPETLDKRT